MRYRYVGPGPQEDDEGHLVRPGDEREFDAEPDWGPWEALEDPGTEDGGGSESPAEPPATQVPAVAPAKPPAAGTAAPAKPPAAGTAAPATGSAAASDSGKAVS